MAYYCCLFIYLFLFVCLFICLIAPPLPWQAPPPLLWAACYMFPPPCLFASCKQLFSSCWLVGLWRAGSPPPPSPLFTWRRMGGGGHQQGPGEGGLRSAQNGPARPQHTHRAGFWPPGPVQTRQWRPGTPCLRGVWLFS